MQGIAAAAGTASYADLKDEFLPLVVDLLRDKESEIRVVVIQQLYGLGKSAARGTLVGRAGMSTC
jgi:hypothetical protein